MPTAHNDLVKNTTHKVVVPFYVYAAVSFLVATVLLFGSSLGAGSLAPVFQPRTLAITHIMVLGWGTMIILGASHQLVPVLIEGKLFSTLLATISFGLAAVGIPLLVISFWRLQFDMMALTGGFLINAAVISFFVNVILSVLRSLNRNVHALFVTTAAAWLCITTLIGLLLLVNFRIGFLPADSVHYLSLHAHVGIVGWFLQLVIGVGARLLPMFLISKYQNPRLLSWIYVLINAALICFTLNFTVFSWTFIYWLSLAALFAAITLFARYCRGAFKARIRKHVDEPVQLSLLSVAMLLLPWLLLAGLLASLAGASGNTRLPLVYGFSVLFGWITAIILGMTFKTFPFIVWNQKYHHRAGKGRTPTPKELFSDGIFRSMGWCYLAGFGLFVAGILLPSRIALLSGSISLLAAAVLYNCNMIKILVHKPSLT